MLDSDQELSDGLLQECVTISQRNHFDSLIIPEAADTSNYWSRCLNFEKKIKTVTGKEYPRFFQKETLLTLRGYDPTLRFGEDIDLYFRLVQTGYSTGKSQREILHHEFQNFSQIIRKYVKYGQNVHKFIEKQSETRWLPQFLLLGEPSTFLQCLLQDPIHGLGFLFLRLLRIMSIVIGFLNPKSVHASHTAH